MLTVARPAQKTPVNEVCQLDKQSRSNGEATRQMVQALPFDIRTIGNHDFGYGETTVLRDVRLSGTPVLAANLRHPGMSAAKQPFRPYARFDVGCVKVGVIGLVTQNYGADDQPNATPFDDVIIQERNYVATLEREAKAHRSEVDVLIALTHLGYVVRAGHEIQPDPDKVKAIIN